METPQNAAGRITEEIMQAFWRHNRDAVVPLETPQYNKVYSFVYSVLDANIEGE